MGDPKLPKKKYKTPSHPWQKGRIEEEKALMKQYGLKNKKEIWKMVSVLRSFHEQAKSLIVSPTEQADKERIQMMNRLASYGLIKPTSDLDDVLGLTVRDILDRRLQTLVVKLGLAHSPKQARQFIIHRHIMVGDSVVTAPSYLVTSAESSQIRFAPRSKLSDSAHPARAREVGRPEIPDPKSAQRKRRKSRKSKPEKGKEKPQQKEKKEKEQKKEKKAEEKEARDKNENKKSGESKKEEEKKESSSGE